MPVVTDNLLGAYLRDRRSRLDPAAFGFGQQGVGRVRQHAVQRAAGFVKQGARLSWLSRQASPAPPGAKFMTLTTIGRISPSSRLWSRKGAIQAPLCLEGRAK